MVSKGFFVHLEFCCERCDRSRHVKYVLAGALSPAFVAVVACGLDVEHNTGEFCLLLCEPSLKLLEAPQVELALLSFTVSVYSGVEAPFR